MTDFDTLKEILTLAKESSERDTRIETQLCYMEKRIAQMEDLTAKMSQTLNEQKQIQFTLNSLIDKINDNTKRIQALEEKSGKLALKAWQKIVSTIVGVGLSSFAAYLVVIAKHVIKSSDN